MIAIGCDHSGLELKKEILEFLTSKGIDTKDFGTYSSDPVDYPDIACAIACSVASGECDRGIIICGTGIGVSITANKIPGVRAALCSDCFSARMAKEHNDANILTLGGRVIGAGLAVEIVKTWIKAEFQGGRHKIRVDKISEIEKRY